MKWFDYSRNCFYFFIFVYFILIITKMISISENYFYLGFLSFYLGVENFLKLYFYHFMEYQFEKINYLKKKYNEKQMLFSYSIFNIALYIFLGIVLIYVGVIS